MISCEVCAKPLREYRRNSSFTVCQRTPACRAEYQQRYKGKATVLAHYGGFCVCCGRTDKLSIDHVAGDGKRHRLAVATTGGGTFYRWLIEQNFPEGFQVLCRPCNTSKGRGFTCALHDYKFLGPEELRFYF